MKPAAWCPACFRYGGDKGGHGELCLILSDRRCYPHNRVITGNIHFHFSYVSASKTVAYSMYNFVSDGESSNHTSCTCLGPASGLIKHESVHECNGFLFQIKSEVLLELVYFSMLGWFLLTFIF